MPIIFLAYFGDSLIDERSVRTSEEKDVIDTFFPMLFKMLTSDEEEIAKDLAVALRNVKTLPDVNDKTR